MIAHRLSYVPLDCQDSQVTCNSNSSTLLIHRPDRTRTGTIEFEFRFRKPARREALKSLHHYPRHVIDSRPYRNRFVLQSL